MLLDSPALGQEPVKKGMCTWGIVEKEGGKGRALIALISWNLCP